MFYDTRLIIRFRSDELKLVDKLVRKNKERFDSLSDFIRATVVKELRSNFPKEMKKIDKEVMFV